MGAVVVEDGEDMLADHPPLRLVGAGAGACLDVHAVVEAGLIEVALEGEGRYPGGSGHPGCNTASRSGG